METLNDLTLERFRLVDEYVGLSKQLASFLATARLSFSKAKTLHGITLAGLADPDSIDLVASIRINEQPSYYVIETEKPTEKVTPRKPKSDEDQKEEEPKQKSEETAAQNHSFRPFGVLEPMAAKEGRKTMVSAINVICDMATAQQAIKKIDEEIRAAMKEVDIDSIIDSLKIK